MKKKFLIIGPSNSEENDLIEQEAEKKDYTTERLAVGELFWGGRHGMKVFTSQEEELSNFDVVLFRGISPYFIESKIIARYLQSKGVKIVDEVLAQGDYEGQKLSMHSRMFAHNVPQPPTFFALSAENLKKVLKKLELPVMVKHIKGSHRQGVFKFSSEREILRFFQLKEKLSDYLIQQWYPCDYFYRVIVLGNKVLGAMQRTATYKGDNSKVPYIGSSKQVEVFPELGEVALKAKKAIGIEFAGVDIILDQNNHPRVLEVNRAPQFRTFFRKTGVNVAKEVVEYLSNKES